MRTTREINGILSACKRVDSHVHTHLCDGAAEMTVENIAAAAQKKGIDGIILTPHFHKQLSDGEDILYSDSSEDIFLELRRQIDFYERCDGKVKFILSTEVDIVTEDGDISLDASAQTEAALDMVAPTLNFHPLLPLKFVGLTMGRKIDALHDSGEYKMAAEALGGIPGVLSSMYEIQRRAILRCPYPSMLGHIFMAHSFHPRRNNCFGAQEEHLEQMKTGVQELLLACKEREAIVDLTGVHVHAGKTADEKINNNGFLFDFQRFVAEECGRMGVAAYYGSDAHNLCAIGAEMAYYHKLLQGIAD